jgi:xylose isomerase
MNKYSLQISWIMEDEIWVLKKVRPIGRTISSVECRSLFESFFREDTMSDYEFGAGVWMFQQFIDRYATDAYGPPVGTLEAIELAAEVGDIKALDINYPFAGEDVTIKQVHETLQRTGLRAHAITPHLYMREFRMGSFTNPDLAMRRKAIDLGKRAIEVARALDATYVKFWPGQDGFDYPFQVDYRRLWDYSVEGVRAVAQADPQMQFAIEYKEKEPRSHMFFSSAARTLLAIEDMGVENVGIVFDLGHSFYAKETPAEVVQLVARRGKLVSVELNDNWRDWDDDMAVGSVHLIETLEFLYALRQINWQGPLLLDQFPFRENPVQAARISIRTIRKLNSLLDRFDLSTLVAAQDRQDALAAQQIVLDMLLGTGNAKD